MRRDYFELKKLRMHRDYICAVHLLFLFNYPQVRPAAEYLEEHGFVPQANFATCGALAELVFSLEGAFSSGGGKLGSVKCADDKV